MVEGGRNLNIQELKLWNFGKFQHASFKFNSKFNCIFGPNEAGKTTIFNALELAFYGSNSRKEDPRVNIRQRYVLENDISPRILIYFNSKGKNYRLDRTLGKSSSRDIIKLFDELTGEEINIVSSKSPGETILGMDYESFRSTLLISPSYISFSTDKNDSLKKQLGEIYNFENDNLSISAFQKKIEEEKKKLRSMRGKSARLDVVEEKIHDLTKKKEISLEKEQEKNTEEKLLNELYEEKANLSKRNKENRDKKKALIKEELDRLIEKGSLIDSSLNEFERKKDRLVDEKHKVQLTIKEIAAKNHKFRDDEKQTQLEEEYKRISEEISKHSALNAHSSFYTILFLISVVLFIAAYFIQNIRIYLIVLAILTILPCLTGALSKNSKKRANDLYLERLEMEREKVKNEMLFVKFGYSKENEENKQSLNQKEARVESLDKEIIDIEEKIKNASLMRDKNRLDLENLTKTRVEMMEEKSEVDDGLQLEKEIDEIKRSIFLKYAGFQNAEGLASKIRELESEHEELEKEYKSWCLLEEIVGKITKERDRSYLPLLNKEASLILKKITGNKEQSIKSDPSFSISMEDEDEKILREWRLLSTATGQQAYLSLRLAIIELLDKECELPIFIDDALVYYDDSRASKAIDFLIHLSESNNRQIIYFTSHKRQLASIKESEFGRILEITEEGGLCIN